MTSSKILIGDGMSIVINDDNLLEEEINTYTNKVRALLISDNQILIAHYANIILLPGVE